MMMYENSDKERRLLTGLVAGDESAFCELYAMYKSRLIFFALKFLKSPQFAEDIYQDAFSAVWQNRATLNPHIPFSPYIYTIMRNLIINSLSRIDKERELKNTILSKAIDYTNDNEDRILDKDLNDILEKALDSLTPQQKRIFEMSRKQLKSHKEIADELGISVHTVQQHISASLQAMRKFLQKYTDIYTDMIILIFCLNL